MDKQIIERLKTDLDFERTKRKSLQADLKAKEQECEELKKERDTLSITRNKLLDDLWVTEENLKDYMEHFNKASDELDQLKQTLIEIKEIAEKQVKRAPDGETFARPEFKQILQKISECEVKNGN